MSEALRDILNDWTCPLWLTLFVVTTALVYVVGWSRIRKTRSAQFTVSRLASFIAGLAVLWLAIGSPLDGLADALLSAHMVEHLLLMSAVPPLLLLGLPVVPLLRGLPNGVRKFLAGPLLRMPYLRHAGHWLVTPLVAWLAMNLAFLTWHVPVLYDFALEHEGWHVIEHVCFLGTSILFWFCVLRPWPMSTGRRDWGILLFLVSADVVNTLLSAFLSFYGRPVYRYYVDHPNQFHLPPLEDQVLGAVIMWVIGSFAFLIPAMWITVQMLQAKRAQ